MIKVLSSEESTGLELECLFNSKKPRFGIGMLQLIPSSPDLELESEKIIRQIIFVDLRYFWREQ